MHCTGGRKRRKANCGWRNVGASLAFCCDRQDLGRGPNAHFGYRRFLSLLARAYAGLSQFDDAWRCIDEAMTAVETTKEKWCEAEVHRVAGEIALLSQEPDAA